ASLIGNCAQPNDFERKESSTRISQKMFGEPEYLLPVAVVFGCTAIYKILTGNQCPREHPADATLEKPKKVIVIGAGVAGLSLATFLVKCGYEVEVYEQASQLKPNVGGGFELGSAAVLLARAGFEQDLRTLARPIKQFRVALSQARVCTWDMRKIVGKMKDYGYGKLFGVTGTIMRDDLQLLLANRLPEGTIRLSKRIESYTETATGVIAHFEDGTSTTGDLLAGADGIHSKLRELLYGPTKKTYSGVSMTYMVCPRSALSPEMLQTAETEHDDSLYVGFPGGGLQLFLAQSNSTFNTGVVMREDEPGDEAWTAVDKAAVIALCKKHSVDNWLGGLISECQVKADRVFKYFIYSHLPLKAGLPWHK
ncbi:hypothetical protein CYMTET_34074, partial [Cymbomonas tetramitiformis]